VVNKWRDALLDGLFPAHCLLCGLHSDRLPLCEACRLELPLNTDSCDRCALPLPLQRARSTASDPRLCGNCLSVPPWFDSCIAPYQYDEQFAVLIQRWKYRPEPRLAHLMATLWLQAAPPILPPVDLLVPVPLHWRKVLSRGFNQAQQLCQLLRRSHPQLCAVPMDPRRCRRQRPTGVQAGLDARARRRNVAGAFTTRGGCANLRVAIVDDVVTTGATANALAQCLARAGARTVSLWCMARTPAPPD